MKFCLTMDMCRRISGLAAALWIGLTIVHSVQAQESADSSRRQTRANRTKQSGIDKTLFAADIDPGDNFYRYANQQWLDSTKIPGDKADYGIFTVLSDRTRQRVRVLIENAARKDAEPGTPAQKVGDLYNAVMDTAARNEAGLQPIQSLIDSIDAAEDRESLASVMGKLVTAGVYGPFAPYVSVDAKNSDAYTVYVTQSGLSLPDRDYYLEDNERYQKLRQQLSEYIADLLKAGGGDGEQASAVVKIETQIAENHWTKTENRDPDATYNATSPADLNQMLGSFDWPAFASACGIEGQDKFVVRQPSYLQALGKFFEQHDLAAWKAYLKFHTLDAYASSLTETLEKRHFDFHDSAVSGIDQQEALWKRAVGVTGSVLGEVVGQLYVEKYFTPRAKRRMSELVDNLKAAFEKRIDQLDWMGDGTKKQAKQKLDLFTTKIGYPDEWKDYSSLNIQGGPLAKHLIAASRFEHQRELDKLGGPIDRNEWHMTPQTINAYYNPVMNEIVFPAGILQPPFFNLAADDAVNYGAIGAVIGHEISHGFDDKGSKYDGYGNLRMWWTPDDREEFERRASVLTTQYDGFAPFDDMNVNGKLTLGENIGDLGGLSVAYEAYRLSLDGKEAPVIDGLTGDQRFFLGWAQIWRRLYRESELRKRLITDPHSPSEYRVNGIVRNMDAWYDAFDIQTDDELYLAPEDRVRIW
ncbi:M13 family metallopeptidase [Crateriforma conspicua]|uniref:Neutral endopeptidase n=1 Tax=Crateriforma conspicua TaxID=2527996 RepID=A0A5C5Y1K0_9PLAN|nr:M13 family metallopeptidase [Crateriforma conspicua]TWT69094.1 Neutral endopeptidase [Crateriforma conspicua]